MTEHMVEFMRSDEYTGTESVKKDPALRLLTFALADLMGLTPDVRFTEYGELTRECERRMREG